ncbi:hypothetical protein ACFQ2B_00365 [Streptomyces stramineus]|uniref:hypothetical protein n=1 Tax=Streptomyces TaxID=1883 RepID=UPI0031CE45CC
MSQRPTPLSAACVHDIVRSARRLTGAEAAVIIVIVLTAAALAALARLPLGVVLALLAGAAFVAVTVVALVSRGPSRAVAVITRAMLSSTAQGL